MVDDGSSDDSADDKEDGAFISIAYFCCSGMRITLGAG